ncbi:hypothetical protein BP6252_01540 [Coleophoma cylindrospora]|uniref:Uncharacterized protein n=1 Tax=Coleophoma cylindrospora TaxID=1849047 RepID=A0A3D8SUP7_9HELO|nr:hypothetical protein BP6252_01540 [Coleophoma cylindrospora]
MTSPFLPYFPPHLTFHYPTALYDGAAETIRLQNCNAASASSKNHQGQHAYDLKGSDISLYAREEVNFGRSPECNYMIVNTLVSKHHFRIYSIVYEDTSSDELASDTDTHEPLIFCEDLESRNGTFVNGNLIGKFGNERIGYLLSNDDVIEIRPHWTFRFMQRGTQAPLPLPWRAQAKYFASSYKISERSIGSGCTGTVYLAKDLSTSKQLACKIINRSLALEAFLPSAVSAADPEGVPGASVRSSKVMREIEILSQLSHPNVINLKQTFISDCTIYMFLELATAGDLFSYLETHDGFLDDAHSRAVTRQIAIAVDYIHSKGIAHRDIKPENILVTRRDIGHRVVLTDFGFAIKVDHRASRMKSKLGTTYYSAPEIMTVEETEEGYTIAADMYSLGVVTLCTLVGSHILPTNGLPSPISTGIQEHFNACRDDSAESLWGGLSSLAKSYICGLLHSDPVKRYDSRAALAHSWYTHPRGHDPEEAENLYKRSIKFWQPREPKVDGIKYLPNYMPDHAGTGSQKHSMKLRYASSSPYFNMRRHNEQKTPSHREHVLAVLAEHGSQFISDNLTDREKSKTVADSTRLKTDAQPTSKIVRANDLFGAEHNILPSRTSNLQRLAEGLSKRPMPLVPETGEPSTSNKRPRTPSCNLQDSPIAKRTITHGTDMGTARQLKKGYGRTAKSA